MILGILFCAMVLAVTVAVIVIWRRHTKHQTRTTMTGLRWVWWTLQAWLKIRRQSHVDTPDRINPQAQQDQAERRWKP